MPSDLTTPPDSSRYLLSDNSVFLDGLSDYDPILALVPFGNKKTQTVVNQEEAINAAKDNSASDSECKPQQVF